MMFVLRAGDDKTSTWYSEKGNISEDFKRLIGEDTNTIDAVAIMTDADNTVVMLPLIMATSTLALSKIQ